MWFDQNNKNASKYDEEVLEKFEITFFLSWLLSFTYGTIEKVNDVLTK